MSSLREHTLPLVNRARATVERVWYRPYQCTVITRQWAGRRVGEGLFTDTRLTIVPSFKTRLVSLQEVAGDAGTLRDGDFRIGPVTPVTSITHTRVRHTGTGTGTVALTQSIPQTGVLQGKWTLVVTITTGGTQFTWSIDGGVTTSSPVNIGTFQVPGIGMSMSFTGSFVDGDVYRVKGESCGYTRDQLRRTTTLDNVQTFYELVGREGTLMCTMVRYDEDRALRDTIYIRRTRLTP